MADVKWIKITTDMFDNRKIKALRRLPDGNSIVLIWVMLLTMAGRCNAGGMIFLTENIPYTPKTLADELDFEENTVLLALEALERYGMVENVTGGLFVSGWEEYQNVDGLDKIREQTRKRVAKYRENKKTLPGPELQRYSNVTVTQCNAADIDKELEGEREEEYPTVSKDTVCPTDVRRIVQAWNSLGISQVQTIKAGTKRHDMLKRRIKEYGADTVVEAVERIRQSGFLMGENNNGWVITFDWFVKPNNFIKVLEGNYDSKQPVQRMGQSANPGEKKNGYTDFMAQLAVMRE